LGGDGVTLCQRIQHHFDDSCCVIEYFVVPESKHRKSGASQITCPCLVVFNIVSMLATGYFHNDFCFEANEIQDVVAIGMLSPDLHPSG
jgi:hypothetical protein